MTHYSYMFHYIRSYEPKLPHSYFYDIAKLKRQVSTINPDSFVPINCLSPEAVGRERPTFSLTFDDGLAEHFTIAKILSELSIRATFYISTKPLETYSLLPVHRCQLLMARYGQSVVDSFFELADTDCSALEHINHVDVHFAKTYSHQVDQVRTKIFKRFINYSAPTHLVESYLSELEKLYPSDINPQDFYLSEVQIKQMAEMGHEIGSHGISHQPMSRLDRSSQSLEAVHSRSYLQNIIEAPVLTFCYPYGTRISYNSDSLSTLREAGYDYAVSVESRPINCLDVTSSPFELPRYDCNCIDRHGYI